MENQYEIYEEIVFINIACYIHIHCYEYTLCSLLII